MSLKNILLATTLMLASGTFAQTTTRMPYGAKKTNMIASRWNNYDRHQYFSVRLGLNISQMYYNGMESGFRSRAGFDFGLYSGWQLGSDVPIFFETGLEYSGKGAKSDPRIVVEDPAGTKTDYGKASVYSSLHYLEIPFVFKYKIHTGVRGLTIQPLFGGFMAFGVGGVSKYYFANDMSTIIPSTAEYGGYRAKESSFRDGGYRAFDAGLRLGCGIAYTNFYFEMRYDIGLYDIASDNFRNDKLNKYYGYDGFDNSIHTGCISMTVGVEF